MAESFPPPPPPSGAQGPPPPPGWTPPPTPPSEGGSRTGLVIGIVVAVLAALGVGAFFLFRDDSGEAASEVTDPDPTISEITLDLTNPERTFPGGYTLPDFSLPDLPSDTTAPAEIPPATQDPDGLGDDPQLDALAADCFDGDMEACDGLYEEASPGTEYRTYGDTCAGRQPALTQRFCVNTFPS